VFPAGSSFVAALDANVLFGYPLRDTLLHAGEAELYRPAWSEDVWAEVVRNLQDPRRKRPHTPADVQHLMDELRKAFKDAFVDGYHPLIPSMPIEIDTKDRHVAAMAVRAGAQVLVTYNTKHFPAAQLALYGIKVQKPDDFLHDLYLRVPLAMVEVIRTQSSLLENPPKTPHEILNDLEKVHVRRFVHAIRTHIP
jgi:predicted nucleic acid-binding protein